LFRSIIIVLISFLLVSSSFAGKVNSFSDVSKGTLFGRVLDENNQPLIGANIVLLKTNFGVSTDTYGKFFLNNVPVGKYTLKVSYIGYKPKLVKLVVKAGKKIRLKFKLFPKTFNIGGITVSAKSDLIPRDVETKTEISGAEVEHYQATNIGDVLDLVPGVSQTANPGLNKTNQVAIRGDEGDNLSAFGTKVIVDGMPESNNANLQFEALTGAKFGMGTVGRGVDLRTIPADNVKSITVITGLPSVRYGDFTNGIIEVRTKIGAKPNRLKIKHNPSTSEANFGGGIAFGNNKNSISYNLNVARSQRDLRLIGDEYTRYTGQLVLSQLLWDGKLESNIKLSGQGIYDEENPMNDLKQTKNYNRGFSVALNTWGKLSLANMVSNFDYTAYLKLHRINSKKSRLRSEYLITPEHDTVAAYIGTLENIGREWTAGGSLDWKYVFFTGDYIHKILIGGDLQYDANTGEGIKVDSVYNYYGSESGKRSYSYEDIPGQSLLSLYAEDKITGNLFVDFSLMFGFRYEMYRPYSINIGGLFGKGDFVKSHQGSFFNPRLSMIFYLNQSSQIRMSAGRTSKSPPMSMIYPPEDVMKWRSPADSLVHYFRLNRQVPGLKGYQNNQYEISFDKKFFRRIGVTLSFYYRERVNQPSNVQVPYFTEANVNGENRVYYVDYYYKSQNIGKSFSKGVEFKLRTAKIKPLNMSFTVAASYGYVNNPGAGYSYDVYPDTSIGQYPNYHVPGVSVDTLIGWRYPKSGKWSDKIQINYYAKYTNKTLGMWITLRAEQLFRERYQYYDLQPVDYDKLSEQSRIIRDYNESIISRPNKWLFNFVISKSLFPGSEISFYVNNFLDDPALYRYYNVSSQSTIETSRNPNIFYGMEFSMLLDKFWRNK
jgi:hypothetical protein